MLELFRGGRSNYGAQLLKLAHQRSEFGRNFKKQNFVCASVVRERMRTCMVIMLSLSLSL